MSDDNICLGCKRHLLKAGFLRLDSTQYQPSWYCDTPQCPRYGLVTIYKAKEK